MSIEVNRRTLLRAAPLIGGAAALSACGVPKSSTSSSGAAAAPSGAPVKGGSAVLAIQDDPVNMDPADGQIYASIQVYDNIFSKLLAVTPDFTFVGDLATKWNQDDAQTWSFTIADNAFFSNGDPVTATDVAYSVTRMKTHALSAFVSFFDSVEVIDPHNFKIHLSKPYGPMEATLASFVGVVSKKAVTTQDPKLHPVGSGPYQMTSWVQGSHVALKRWDKYYGKTQPYLDTVTFQSVSDDSVRLSGLQSGQFDWIQTVPQQQATSLLTSSSIQHTPAKAYLPYLAEVNCTAEPFSDVRVRQAVNWAIDRSAIVKLAFSGNADEATEAISKVNPFFSGVNFYAGGPNIAKAKALMAQAKPSRTTIEILVEAEDQAYTLIAQVLQSNLAQIGLKATISTASSADYFTRMATQKYDLAMTYFSASMDPALSYRLLGYSTSGFNFSGLKSKVLDQALDTFTLNGDQASRKAYYPTLVKLFQEQSPFIFLANQYQQYWTSPKLHGAAPLPNLDVNVAALWKSK
ncbi:MAG TPA: ABC transporter substrate-binding protein [Trebonia sp.]|jgi:peptide/nickel transport system substrate-binding protein|nr:ABC transporter substrate-binding protein [Trebonia sp.]